MEISYTYFSAVQHSSCRIPLLEHPFPVHLLDHNRTLLIQRLSARMQDSCGNDGVLYRRKPLSVKVFCHDLSRVHLPRGVHELFDGDVSIAPLPVKVTRFARGVLHIKRIEPTDTLAIDDDIISTMCLVNIDLPLFCHIVKVLFGMNACSERRGPGGSVHCDTLVYRRG